ncbi:MAG: hypothetical protein QXG00_03775 [Candidatus Woesearchaeota archaeon]
MNIAERALAELFPEKKEERTIIVKYSRAFSDYNANVKFSTSTIQFRLSYKWKEVSDEIKVGLIQMFLLKIYNEKKNTINIELYEKFIKHMSTYAVKNQSDPILEESFKRVNEKYFNGFIEQPNLKWSNQNFRKLGSYEYVTDTITISNIFEKEKELLDYIMYHECLHKKLKYYSKNGRSFHHTTLFREMEKKFDNPQIEKKLNEFLRKLRMRNLFKFW